MGTIKYIGKTITESAESVKWFATKGNIGFNASKEVLLQGKNKIKYQKYEPIESSVTEVEEIRINSKLQQGCHHDEAKGLREGLIYGNVYEFEVIKFKSDILPKNEKSIKWKLEFTHNGNSYNEILSGTGSVIKMKANLLEMCGRGFVLTAYISNAANGGKYYGWQHYRFRWLNREVLKAEIKDRRRTPSKIDQGATSLCGIAIAAYHLANDYGDVYEKFVLEMHQKGEAILSTTNYKVTIDHDEHLVKYKQTDQEYPEESETTKKMASSDFIFLTTIRDYFNDVFDYDPDGPNAGGFIEGSTGITFPSTVVYAMKNINNYKNIINDTNLITSKWISPSKMAIKLKERLNDGYRIAIEINSDNITKNIKPTWTNPNHWVGLLDINNDDSNKMVWMKIYTWARVREFFVEYDVFKDGFFGYIAGK